MEATHQELAGRKDSPEVLEILKSKHLRIDDMDYWNAAHEHAVTFPWNESMRFAERFGILTQHLLETTGRGVKDVALVALELADDNDIIHLEPIRGPRAFVFAVDTLAESCSIGKQLKEWCRGTSDDVKRAFEEWDVAKGFIDLVAQDLFDSGDLSTAIDFDEEGLGVEATNAEEDESEEFVGYNDAFSRAVIFGAYVKADAATYQKILDEFSATGVGAELVQGTYLKTKINLYLVERYGAKDEVSDKIVKEQEDYLTQMPDNENCMPTSDDALCDAIANYRGKDICFLVDDAWDNKTIEPKKPRVGSLRPLIQNSP